MIQEHSVTKHCAHQPCSARLVKGSHESRRDWERRTFCNRACRTAASAEIRAATRRECPICGKLYKAKANGEFALTCGDRACASAIHARLHPREGWPRLAGEILFPPNAFANNVTSRAYGTMPMRPATQVDTISASALASSGGTLTRSRQTGVRETG